MNGKAKSVIEVIREVAVRRAAMTQYAAMHESLAELEQMYLGVGRHFEAEGAAQYCRIVLRAYQAELNDPEPPNPDHDDDVREGWR